MSGKKYHSQSDPYKHSEYHFFLTIARSLKIQKLWMRENVFLAKSGMTIHFFANYIWTQIHLIYF